MKNPRSCATSRPLLRKRQYQQCSTCTISSVTRECYPHPTARRSPERRKGKLLWSLDIVALNQKIANVTRQDRLLAQLKQQGLVDPDIFISRRNELAEQLRAAKLEKERFLESEEDQTIQRTQELIEALEAGPDFLDAFDGELFREPVDKIIVGSNDRLRFRLVNGLELTEPIERTVR